MSILSILDVNLPKRKVIKILAQKIFNVLINIGFWLLVGFSMYSIIIVSANNNERAVNEWEDVVILSFLSNNLVFPILNVIVEI